MTWTIVEKEIRAVLTSPKFVATFTVCAVLILLSIGLGVREYRAFEEQQAAARGLVRQELDEAEQWAEVRPRAFRPADPLQIFVTGVHYDVGRVSVISEGEDVELRRGVYEDDPALAVFRTADFGHVVTLVLSLFAILFTYDSVSGERENGTLRLALSNPVGRARFIVAKLVGTWLGLAVPLALPVLLGVLWVVLAGVPLDGHDWSRLVLLVVAAGLYFTVFVALGVAVSALSSRSSTSFLALLAVWIVVVLVVPRAALTAAAHLRPVPTVAETTGAKAAFENAQWGDHQSRVAELWRQRSGQMEGLAEDEAEAFENEHLWQWMEEDDALRREVEARIADNGARLDEVVRNREAAQARLALSLGRPSPATVFRLVAMTLAGTDHALKDRSEEAMRRYRQDFSRFVESRAGASAGQRRIVVRGRSSGNLDIAAGDDQAPVDLGGMPVFEMPTRSVATLTRAILPDLGLLAALVLLPLAVAVAGFLRQDITT